MSSNVNSLFNRIKKIVCILLIFSGLMLDSENKCIADNGSFDDVELISKSAILMDADSKRVLFEKNSDDKMAMASTTKIMTCLVALENTKGDEIVEFSKKAASQPKTKLGAGTGTRFKVNDLLYSLMLESHNDTAVAIAEAVSGTTVEFANLMNKRAKQIGAKNTNFITPNGLDDEKHYSTAYDMALIAAEAIKNKSFLEIIKTRNYEFNDIDGKYHYCLGNKDAFLDMVDGAIGIKTGYTSRAGYCFVGAVKKENKTLISVVLAAGWPPNKSYKWGDTKKLMKYGMENFEFRTLFQGCRYKKLKTKNAIEPEVDTFIIGNISTLISKNDRVEYLYEIDDEKYVTAPKKCNAVVGYLCIKINGSVFKRLPIVTANEIHEYTLEYELKKIIKKLLL